MQQKKLALSSAAATLFIFSPLASLAQQDAQNFYRAPSKFAGKTVVLPIGTTFEGRIQSTIGSRQSRSGESFSVEVSAPILANGTEVLIPSGSEVIGEVAEAISSASQPHDKNTYAKLGILRVQITTLKMPDGQTYPLIASFAADGQRGGRGGDLTARKSSVAYVGTQAGFDAVNPALQQRNQRQNQGKMQVLGKSQIMSDPILGDQQGNQSNSYGQVRSLVRRGRELIIMRGSSITIRLDGPLKIALGVSNAQNSVESAPSDEAAPSSKSKHFAKSRPAPAPEQSPPQGQGQAQGQDQSGNTMADPTQSSGNPQPATNGQAQRQPAAGPQPGSEF
jgi:hypothetical protein